MELNVSGPVSPQSLTKISPVEQKKKHCGWINPILGATHPDYLRKPSHGLAERFLHRGVVHGERLLQSLSCRVLNGRFAYAGKVYEAQPLPKIELFMIPAARSASASLRLN
jgi:hypothetical protein